MLALEIQLLTGRYAAAAVNDQRMGEWPPHPARVFSAMIAVLYDDEEPAEEEVRAMQWLECAGAPDILASKADFRRMGNVFVPTNDQKALSDIDKNIDKLTRAEESLALAEGKDRPRSEKAVRVAREELITRSGASAIANGRGAPSNAAELLNRRLKPQPRFFPVAIPQDPTVHLVWESMPEPGAEQILDRVASRVSRLGHSSSLISMRVFTDEKLPDLGQRDRWSPAENGDRIRVVGPGQLERLQRAHERHRQVEQRILPAESIAYRPVGQSVATAPAEGVFSSREEEWFVFEVVPAHAEIRRRMLDVSLTQHVARAMRGTLLRHIDPGSSPDALTGHDSDGKPTALPHVAYVPLSDVRAGGYSGSRYATGSILGLALVPPRAFGTRSRDLLIDAIHAAEVEAARSSGEPFDVLQPPALRLTLGRHGVLHIRRLRHSPVQRTLEPNRWTEPSRHWATATAIALGRNPGNLFSRDSRIVESAVAAAERTIRADCVSIGLPEPSSVWIHRRSLLDGSPPSQRFMPFPNEGTGRRRVCVHAELVFDEPVRGPVILGAGRFFGVGLCAPLKEAE